MRNLVLAYVNGILVYLHRPESLDEQEHTMNTKESVFTSQPGVIIAGIVAWMQTFIDTTMPVIQWIVAIGTAILVLFNVTLKGMEVIEKIRSRKVENKED